MKFLLQRAGLLTCLSLGLFALEASAESNISSKCSSYGEIKQNENPSFQHINCLLTNAALNANIPPEVVKAVAWQESDWIHINSKGAPNISYDGGIGIMQITNIPKEFPDINKLQYDISYNIEAGVKILSDKYKLLKLPKIKDAGPEHIENWYFPVMAYNGLKSINGPVFQQGNKKGEKNSKAYQEEVFYNIYHDSFLQGSNLAQYPFKVEYFTYDSNNTIKFLKYDYILKDPLHTSNYLLKKGDKVVVTGGEKLRERPSTGKEKNKLAQKNTVLTVTGNFSYDKAKDSKNQFVWFPVKTADGKSVGYVSSAYIMKKEKTWKDTVKPEIFGAVPKTINLNSTFNPKTAVTAKDNADGDLTKLIKVTGTVNTKKIGKYPLKYVVTDKSQNTKIITRIITVKDMKKPVIYGATDKTIKLKSTFNPKTGVTAIDSVDGNLTKLIKITKTVNTKKKGTYILTYTVSDKSGNKVVKSRKIIVK